MSSRFARLRYHLSASAMSDESARSLQTLHHTAANPPQRVHRPSNKAGKALVLYIFRVPGRSDLCLSTARPGGDVVTDIDIAVSLYYIRVEAEGDTTRITLVRRNPALESNIEVAMIIDPPGHIDVYEDAYNDIETRYWQTNSQDQFSVRSSFGCYVRNDDGAHYFSSPWAGVCTFVSAKMGNAMKCIHSLQHFEGGPSPVDVPVSELRFNFMASASGKAKILAKRASMPLPLSIRIPTGSEDHMWKRRSIFSRSDPVTSTSSTRKGMRADVASGTDPSQSFRNAAPLPIRRKPIPSRSTTDGTMDGTTDESLDLSLGKEKLGGGFDGEQAKLAKLIVEAEGEKMLDLLIAANMLVFRRAFLAAST